ncbi:hypothetical protein [Pandoraea fibrosis]|uniref:Uncharacterized protein n=1 Tax=Pandoraea fibrosis TaxID=1891094 RepID=A0A5E4Z074_9BURK|nr:hypothetical protein [Pandoraea fibrosis]VVE54584.1 hypothetical protein PFI31113_04911 [Pandoraea fibrosis]
MLTGPVFGSSLPGVAFAPVCASPFWSVPTLAFSPPPLSLVMLPVLL